MIRFILPLLLCCSVAAYSQPPKYDTLVLGNSFYTEPWRGYESRQSPDQSSVYYVNMTKGDYSLCFKGAKPNSVEDEYQLDVTIKEAGEKTSTLISKSFTVKGSKPEDLRIDNISIPHKAFYRIEIKGKIQKRRDPKGVHIDEVFITTPKDMGGYARLAKWLSSPSVHLAYRPDDEQKYEYDWLYAEVNVPKGYDPMYTFYMSIGYYRGYFGIQVNSATERRVLFSVWDSSNEGVDRNKVKQEDRVVLLDKSPQVKANSFGNEGTGGQSYWKYPWNTGDPVKFLMNMRKLPGDFVVYSAWFMDKESEGWKYMASWRAPQETRYFDGFYSFVENFGHGTGQAVRKADYYNTWGKKVSDGQWLELNKARLTHTDGVPNGRSDYGGGISAGNPSSFFMTSGGYTDSIDSKQMIVAKKTGIPPKVDIAAMSAIVDKAIATNLYKDDPKIASDIKVKVERAEASESQGFEGINKSIDDDMSTIYHSRWNKTSFPVSLTYYFNNKDLIDYFVYYPRTEGENGHFGKVEVWASTASNPQFVKTGEYDFNNSSSPSKISFVGGLKSPKAVKIVVKSGENDFASCAEMSFYVKAKQTAIPPVFTDETCTALLPGVGNQQIDTISNQFYKKMALALLNNTYQKEFRIQEFRPYPHPEKIARENKTSTYSLLDNPTGISVHQDDELVAFVGNTGGENISLRLIDFDRGFGGTDYLLSEGANKLKMDKSGLLYVMYHTDNKNAKPVKIHFATGQVNGYFDITKHNANDWNRILNNTCDKHFDVLGKYTHLTFPASSFKDYCPDGIRLVQVYDSIAWLEQRFMGLFKYNRGNTNRMYLHVVYDNAYMYATSYRTAYQVNTLKSLCDYRKLRSTDVWGPAHELGHVNQTRPGLKWIGMTEVSNNIYSMYVQAMFGNAPRLGGEKQGRKGSNDWNNQYEKGFTEIVGGKAVHGTYDDVFCKLIPFWQLELYYSNVKGYTDFYGDVLEQVRKRPNPVDDGTAQLDFVKICCDVAKEDLTDFFKAWGMLSPVDKKVNDYGTQTLKCTSKQIDDVIRYAKKYPKPKVSFQYIQEDNIDAYKKNGAIVTGKVEKNDTEIKFTDWKNVAAYELQVNGKPVLITPMDNITLPKDVTKFTVYAISVKGEKKEVKI